MRRTGRDIARAAFVIGLLSTWPAAAQQWPQFRGPGASGVAVDDPRLPDTWSATDNVAWSVAIPGRGWSSPVVWGDHVLVVSAVNTRQVETLNPVPSYLARSLGGTMSGAAITQATDEYRWMLYDVDVQTGRIRWERVIKAAVPDQAVHQKNSFASETPVTDGERVYVYLGYAGLFAFDMTGQPVWAKPMAAPRMRTGWGTAASPVLHDGRLYIVNDNEDRSFIAAFDARTGAELWRTERPGEASNWSSPFIWQTGQRTEIVTTGTRKVRSYDTNGALLWEFAGMTSIHAVTPVASHGLLFVSSGYFPDTPRPTYAIRPGARGDISLEAGEDEQRVHRVVEPDPRVGVPLADCRRRSVLHADGSWHRDRDRPVDGPRDLRPPAHRARHGHLFGVAMVVQREDLRHQRGRRDVRDADRPAVQAPEPQPAERDDAGHARDREREPVHPHRHKALSHHDRCAGARSDGRSLGVRRPGFVAGRVRRAGIEAARRLDVAHRLRVADLRREVAEQSELLHHPEVVGRLVLGRRGAAGARERGASARSSVAVFCSRSSASSSASRCAGDACMNDTPFVAAGRPRRAGRMPSRKTCWFRGV